MVLIWIGIVLCAVFAVVGYYSERKVIINPVTIFCGLWAMVLFLSSLQYYTLQMASDEINLSIILGVTAYFFGFYVNKLFLNKYHLKVGKKSKRELNSISYMVPRYNQLYTLCIVCILYSLYSAVNVILQSGGINLGAIQLLLQSGEYEQFSNPILSALIILIISPVQFAIPAITAVDFWFGRRDRKLLWLTILLLIVTLVSTANRTSFILFIIFLIITAVLRMYHNRLNAAKGEKRKIKKKLRALIIFGIVAFAILTISRGSKLMRNILTNFAIPPRMYDIWAESIEKERVYGYGIASLLGFIYPVLYVFKNVLGLEQIPALVQEMYDWSMLVDSRWVWPGTKVKANAYITIFWSMYIDGRLIGIIIGMFIVGIMISRNYRSVMEKHYSCDTLCIYCMMFYLIMYSFVRFQMTTPRFVLSMLYICCFAYKRVPQRQLS